MLGLTLVRMLVGGLFVGHGLQKLLGRFGGPGIAATAEGFESLGLRPGKTHAVAAGSAEAGGGALLAAGACTPLATTALTATMTTAIRTVHGPKGPWNAEGGYEYNLTLIALLFALVDSGPGPFSLDASRGHRRWGSKWAIAQLAAGLAGSAAAVKLGRREPDSPQPEEP
jgi:putative oxidoreductase